MIVLRQGQGPSCFNSDRGWAYQLSHDCHYGEMEDFGSNCYKLNAVNNGRARREWTSYTNVTTC